MSDESYRHNVQYLHTESAVKYKHKERYLQGKPETSEIQFISQFSIQKFTSDSLAL
jgi:hypothetical protein